jgi:ATP-dependent Clp protease ATP-binding subunit ClpA
MISAELRQYVDSACNYAVKYSERAVSLVHILIAILDDEHLQHALARCGVSYLDIRQGAIDALANRLSSGAVRTDIAAGLSALTLYTLQSAQQKAAARGAEWAGVLDFVAAVLEIHDNDSFDFQARVILSNAGLTVSAFSKARSDAHSGDRAGNVMKQPWSASVVHHGIQHDNLGEPDVWAAGVSGRVGSGLPFFCTDMTALAREGRYDRSYGREAILDNLQVVLARRKKRSAILIGEPGVGKTSIVEELACRIAEGTAGPKLAGATIVSLDIGALVGGTKYRGELEERIKVLLAEIASRQDTVLFVDEIHALVSPHHSAGVAADLLKPALASGAIRCIGATTLSEYKRYFEADAAMARRFASLNVTEPTRDEAVVLLARSASAFSEFHGVEVPDWANEMAVDLSIRLMPDRRLPDKALELLDAASARAATQGLKVLTRELFETSASSMSGRIVGRAGIESAMTALEPKLREIAEAVRRNEIARSEPMETIAVFSSVPEPVRSGIKRVADALSRPCEYLDMADFREAASVSALLGPPPGYVGFDNGGRLYDIARRSPDCILHIANIDECHPSALAILDECRAAGYVRDTTGRVTSVSRIQFVVSVKKRTVQSGIGFAPDNSRQADDFGIAMVDDAETTVELGRSTSDGIAEKLVEGLMSSANAAGVNMNISSGVMDFVRKVLGDGDREGRREYARLVRRPVLDYLVSRAGDFTVESCGAAIRIIENET